jgi:hypothetical protein
MSTKKKQELKFKEGQIVHVESLDAYVRIYRILSVLDHPYIVGAFGLMGYYDESELRELTKSERG